MSIIKCEKTEKSAYALEFSVDKATFETAVNKVYRQQVKNINIPGFRKGKAPRSIVERMYGKGVFYEDAANELLPAAYEAALEESKLEPVGRAEFDIVSIDENGIVFSAVVPVKPAVEIEGYKGIEAAKDVVEVSEVEIDNEIKVIRERNSRETDIEDETPAAMGDSVKIDFEGFVDDVAFEGGKGEDYNLKLGSGSFIPGFEEQVAGHKIGEDFDVSVTFPEDYHAAELAGKAATFKVTVKAITKIELPELDDDFAKDVSEFDTMAEYRADIEAKIRKRHEDAAESTFEEAIIKALTEKLTGEEIPEAMFEAEQENQLRDFDNRLRMQGLDLQTYFKYTGLDLDGMREQFAPMAERQVKARLALEGVVAAEGIVASEEEIAAEYDELAKAYGMDVEEVKKYIDDDSVSKDICVRKAIDLVKEAAVITEAAEEASDAAETVEA